MRCKAVNFSLNIRQVIKQARLYLMRNRLDAHRILGAQLYE